MCHAGLRHHPEYHSARVTLGRSLLALGQLDDAEQELHLVLAAAPGNLLARRELGEIYLRTDRLADALDQLRAAQALAPQDPDLASTVAELEHQVRPEPAAGAGAGKATKPGSDDDPGTGTSAPAPYVIERSGEPPSELVEVVEPTGPADSVVAPPPAANGAGAESDAGIGLDADLASTIATESSEMFAEAAVPLLELAPDRTATAAASVVLLPEAAAVAKGEPGNGASPNGLLSRLERWLAAIERSRQSRTSSH